MKMGNKTAAMALALLSLVGCDDQAATPRPVASLTLLSGVDTARSDGQRGFNGDVFYHKGFVYIGTWGSSSVCPGSSVKIVDVRTAQAPAQVGSIAEYSFTSSEDVVVRAVATAAGRRGFGRAIAIAASPSVRTELVAGGGVPSWGTVGERGD